MQTIALRKGFESEGEKTEQGMNHCQGAQAQKRARSRPRRSSASYGSAFCVASRQLQVYSPFVFMGLPSALAELRWKLRGLIAYRMGTAGLHWPCTLSLETAQTLPIDGRG